MLSEDDIDFFVLFDNIPFLSNSDVAIFELNAGVRYETLVHTAVVIDFFQK